MSSDAEKKGGDSPGAEHASEPGETPQSTVAYTPTVDDGYGNYEDPYGYDPHATSVPEPAAAAAPPSTPPPAAAPTEEPGDDDDGMLRMSFLEHLEELRHRLVMMLAGLGVAFVVSLTFAERMWVIVQQPAAAALTKLKFRPELVIQDPMEGFMIIWMKMPLLAAIFLASPWLLYQVWAFVAPGLYKRERRWAAPFVICSAGLFILGGLFAYFVAFRFGLTFLLGIGTGINVVPLITVTHYFNLFTNVMLGIGLIFELPVLIFFLTLLRIASPRFLLAQSRYAILIIVVVAAFVTPTPDVFNLTMFCVPMVLLYYLGVFAGYILVFHRETGRLPWKVLSLVTLVPVLLAAGGVFLAIQRFGYKLVNYWPFLIK